MDSDALTLADVEFLLESLRYTKRNFEDTEYPTYEFRQQRLAEVDAVAAKLRRMRDQLR